MPQENRKSVCKLCKQEIKRARSCVDINKVWWYTGKYFLYASHGTIEFLSRGGEGREHRRSADTSSTSQATKSEWNSLNKNFPLTPFFHFFSFWQRIYSHRFAGRHLHHKVLITWINGLCFLLLGTISRKKNSSNIVVSLPTLLRQ